MTYNSAILQSVLCDAGGHLSAIEIWEAARGRGESISLATVYNGLKRLSESGAIKKIQISESNVLYDARVDRHLHLVCNSCGAISDIDSDESFTAIEEEIGNACKYKNIAAEITVRGTCPKCQHI